MQVIVSLHLLLCEVRGFVPVWEEETIWEGRMLRCVFWLCHPFQHIFPCLHHSEGRVVGCGCYIFANISIFGHLKIGQLYVKGGWMHHPPGVFIYSSTSLNVSTMLLLTIRTLHILILCMKEPKHFSE